MDKILLTCLILLILCDVSAASNRVEKRALFSISKFGILRKLSTKMKLYSRQLPKLLKGRKFRQGAMDIFLDILKSEPAVAMEASAIPETDVTRFLEHLGFPLVPL
uniref:Uncharacterized protein n=1 Tax=Trichuris muris TaxID=70415 RepID=A0A5S6QPB0_TRIMR